MFAIIILGFFSLCALALFCYYSYREYRNSRHYKEKVLPKLYIAFYFGLMLQSNTINEERSLA